MRSSATRKAPRCVVTGVHFFVGILAVSAAAQEKALPRVVLVGDSIRIGYAPVVAKLLDRGKAIVDQSESQR